MISPRIAMAKKHLNDFCRPQTYLTDLKSPEFRNGGDCLFGSINRSCWVLPLVFILVGCYANTAYVDVPGQTLRPCSGHTLTAISVQSQSPGSSFNIRWNGVQPFPAEINLRRPATGFRITANGALLLSPEQFKLEPNTVYRVINHTHGDAGPDELTFHTDASGKINSASKMVCK